uniref:BHLH transcription factor n=1 Tax=Dracaena cambodiana TaxID=580341 RepID=A0A7M3UQI2_9ASPA|nr:bHLH transcription factor [Dracaena cambodiana]
MGKDCDPWQFRSFNFTSNVGAPALAKQSTKSMVCPTYADPCHFFHLNSALMPPSNPTAFASGQKKFMVFDRSGDQTNLIYSSFGSQFPYPYPSNGGPVLPASNETDVYNENENVNEEVHEDTEEIDALLYSDSDNDYEEEEEASTGHSPIDTAADFSDNDGEEVANSAVVQPLSPPAKRRRFEPELDPLLADTASSTRCGSHDKDNRKKSKREKIQETVGVLRRIIPGGKGKDAVAVLDEAIRYLKSLRLKAKGL